MIMTRQQLYSSVWSEPMIKLARVHGLSDIGLAKICRKHEIPIPPRGYWAKRQAGQVVDPVPLPNPDRDYGIEMPEPRPTGLSTSSDLADGRERDEEPVQVPETLRGAHELVSRASAELQSAQVGEHGLISKPANATLDIHVGRASLRRALRIMDALLKAIERRDFNVTTGPTVAILGVSLRFGISEQLDVKQVEPREQELEGRYTFGHSRFDQRKIPSGRLTLQIDHGQTYWSSGCRQTWRDTERQKLEDWLGGFLVSLIALAGRLKEREAAFQRQAQERRAEEQRRQEAARARAEKLAIIKAERARVDSLLQWAANWRTSQNLREFIRAIESAHSAAHGMIAPDSEIGRWIAWASQQADRLDPLQESPPSILDEDVSE
jgi:hypothetical protein